MRRTHVVTAEQRIDTEQEHRADRILRTGIVAVEQLVALLGVHPQIRVAGYPNRLVDEHDREAVARCQRQQRDEPQPVLVAPGDEQGAAGGGRFEREPGRRGAVGRAAACPLGADDEHHGRGKRCRRPVLLEVQRHRPTLSGLSEVAIVARLDG